MPQVQLVNITDELKRSYLDYAMSVIISRALPDARDGLKPVQRRILYTMYKLGLGSKAKFRKSATVVGSVLGNYHPHGDAPVYEALVRMAQDFSLRYPLVKGQGNFGSIDSDPPAAQRYTECRLSPIGEAMLEDLEKETVTWSDNFDGTKKEPDFLPAKVPELLINGASGIAVGMATSIPPHNLGEVIDALVFLIDHPQASCEDLLEIIKGPDFPTGGIIYDKKAILKAYGTGKGPIYTRALTEVSPQRIIIKELPYQVNKAQLIQEIAELVHQGHLEAIRDIRDESDRRGIKVVIDLKKGASEEKVLNQLFSRTRLQQKFYLNILALVDGLQPRVLSLKKALKIYIKHRQEVVRRRSQYELKIAEARAHILEGLLGALKQIDEVIKVIKKSSTTTAARKALCQKFSFSPKQAEAILQMRLHRLIALEQRALVKELQEKKTLIARLKEILSSPQKILEALKKELIRLKKDYADPRRTKVIASPLRPFERKDLIVQKKVVITMTQKGVVKRLSPKLFRSQKRGGKGIVGLQLESGDYLKAVLSASTYDTVLFFEESGQVFALQAYEIPARTRTQKGENLSHFISSQGQAFADLLCLREKSSPQYLLIATSFGKIKKVDFENFQNISRAGLKAISLRQNDVLKRACFLEKGQEIFLVSKKAKVLRFSGEYLRALSRSAQGVIGLRLKSQDTLTALAVADSDKIKQGFLLIVTEKGFAKKTPLSLFPFRTRAASQGVIGARVTSASGSLVDALVVGKKDKEILVGSQQGKVLRTSLKNIPCLSRATQGVRLIRLDPGDKVSSVTII